MPHGRAAARPRRPEHEPWPWERAPRVGRLSHSEITFGVVGRTLCTIIMLLPIVWMISTLYFGLLGLAAYVFGLLPWALRDIWRREH